jgi:hypothetical protein
MGISYLDRFQVIQGLAYMHKHGFFHRDMKPGKMNGGLIARKFVGQRRCD